MKKITKNTILKQGDKTFQPVEVDGVIYWVDEVKRNTWCISPTYEKGLKNGIETKFFDESYFEGYDYNFFGCKSIAAQSQPKLEGIPVISLDKISKELHSLAFDKSLKHNTQNMLNLIPVFIEGYKSNPNQYTQKDIEKAIELAQPQGPKGMGYMFSKEEIMEQINSISVIEVDEQFNIIKL